MPTPSPLDRVRAAVGTLAMRTGRALPAPVRRAANAARGIETPRQVTALGGRRPVVLAPHPDDELIGAGGALLVHAARGDHPLVVHVTSGERTAGLAHLSPAERAPAREAEARAAARVLGLDADSAHFLRLPDGGLDPADDAHVASVAAVLAEHETDLVYAPWPLDPHRDHVATAALVARATERLDHEPTVALYEVWSPLTPTHVVDITEQIDTKLAALAEYRAALDSVDYVHTARGLAAYRSAHSMHGAGYAEAFAVMSTTALRALLGQLGARES